MLELRLLSNVRKGKNGLHYPHFFPFTFINNSLRRINVGNIFTLSLFCGAWCCAPGCSLCHRSSRYSVCAGSHPFSISTEERFCCTRIIPVPLLADMHLDCQKRALNTSVLSRTSFSAMSVVSYIWLLGRSSYPSHMAMLLPHSTIMQLHRSHRALDISLPLFVISLLYLWKNSRLFIANNVLQQLPSYRSLWITLLEETGWDFLHLCAQILLPWEVGLGC